MRKWTAGLLLLVMPAPLVLSAPPMKWESLMLMKAEAEKGNPDAQFLIGLQYKVGDGIDKDPVEAARWLRKAAEAGHAEAQNALGALYASNPDVLADPGEAAKWFRASAEQGNSAAQLNLGTLYAKGEGVSPDLAEALGWYLKAAAAGQVGAMKALGEIYARGQGVPKDSLQALKWYRKAAALGDVEAIFILGHVEAVTQAVTHDPERSAPAWKAEAEKGDLGAGMAFDLLATKSRDMDEDPAETVRWSLLLSGLRGADAYLVRGYMLENGIVVNRDLAAAAASYRMAAGQGDARAQVRLGLMYAEGRGVAKDLVESCVWLSQAATNGSTEAPDELAKIKATLTPEQTEAAAKLVHERLGLNGKK